MSIVEYNIVSNLRQRWREQLKSFSDRAIARCYDDFSVSEDFGNNDEKFPEWFESIPTYE